MLPVFINLLRRLYFMRAAARQLKYRIKELYRQTGSRSARGGSFAVRHRDAKTANVCVVQDRQSGVKNQ